MMANLSRRSVVLGLLFTGLVCLPGARPGPIRKFTLDTTAPIVPLFEGEAADQFAIRMQPINAFQSNVFITNTTPATLNVALPKAAVGVHLLPQPGLGNGFFGPQNGNGNNAFGQGQANVGNNQAQSVGGVLGALQPGGQNQNPLGQGQGFLGNGFPSVPPEWAGKEGLDNFAGFITIPPGKSVQLTLKSVCLNYGRPDPMSKMTYRLVSVETFSTDPVLAELLESYSPRVDQDVMQAAAWHVANDMPWNQISQLPLRSLAATSAKLFNTKDVQSAQRLVDAAKERAPDRPKVELPAQVAHAEK